MKASPTSILENPPFEEVAEVAKECVAKHAVLVIVGNCWVEYEGRASSKLGPGERILIIKRDRALLIHRPDGYEPVNWMPGRDVIYHFVTKRKVNSRGEISVNWQPSGCVFHTSKKKSALVIKAIRRKPREVITAYFDRIYLVSVLNLIDKGEFSLYASEEDMQKAILFQPSIVEDGLKPITYEKKVNDMVNVEHRRPGFIDVFCVDRDGRFVVIEIKRKTAGKEAALQLAKYVESLRARVNREVRGILVAPSIAKGVQRLLATLRLEFKPLNPKKCAEILKRTEKKKLLEFL